MASAAVDRHCGVQVMTLAVPGRTRHNFLSFGNPRHLRIARIAVKLAMQRDNGLAGAEGRHEAGGEAGEVSNDIEASALERSGQQLGGAEFLHAELAIVEDHVAQSGERSVISFGKANRVMLGERGICQIGHRA